MDSKVFVTDEDMELLKALHRKSETDRVEYMLMGGAVKTEGGFLVTRLVCPKQLVSAGLVEADGPPFWLKDIQGCFPVWIHTHLCGAFWSGTDEHTIQALSPARKDDTKLKLTVAIVLGRDRMLGRVDVHSPLEVTLGNLDVVVQPNPDAEITADEKIDGMLNNKTSKRMVYGYQGYTGYEGGVVQDWRQPKATNPEKYEDQDTWNKIRKAKGFLV